jgi:ligand-binding sensor domain-containing protein/signal transduction histidine kinase
MQAVRSLFAHVTLALLLSPATAGALDPKATLAEFRRKVWTSSQGLPQDRVQSILQTRDGYLWIGTHEGLARFDGRSFHVFSKGNTPALRSNDIQTLYEDGAGALWIGTAGGGLAKLAHGVFQSFGVPDGVYGDDALAILEDAQHRFWVGNWDGVLLRRDGRFERYGLAYGLAHPNVYSIAEDKDGHVWFGTGGGLCVWRNGRFEKRTTADGLSNDVVRVVYSDRSGNLWVGSDGGLDRFDGARFVHYGGAAGVRAIHEDRDGNLWVGTTRGLTELHRGLAYETPRNALADVVTAVYEDREGTLWIGSEGNGLTQVNDVLFRSYGTRDGLAGDHVKSLHEGPDGSLWIATLDGGVSRFKEGRFTTYSRRHGLRSDSVLSIWADRHGRVWMRSAGGVDVLEGGRIRPVPLALSQTATGGALYEDAAGTMWLAAYAGLYREQAGRLVADPPAGHRPDSLYLSLLEARDGSFWTGRLGGLTRRRRGVSTTFTTADGLSSDYVIALHEDAAGVLWIGTGGGSLCRWADGFRCFGSREGLPSDNVFQILEDDRERLWISSSRGIFRVSKADIESFVQGQKKTIASVLYGVDDGLPSAMCEGESQPAGWKTRDGRLWFPTTKGLAWVDPRRVDRTQNTLPPPVVIQGLVVDGQPVDLAPSVALPPGRRRIELHFAGLSFVAPANVRYRYRLAGFDDAWIDAGQRNTAYYAGLAPGHYVFHVSACNSAGVWNETGASLALDLAPHFHETRWFVALMVATVAALGAGAHQLRMQLARRRFAAVLSERLRLARELHDDLEQELAALGIQVHMLRERVGAAEAAAPLLDGMRGILDRCVAAVRAAVWDLRTGHDLAGALRAVAARVSDGKSITVTVHADGATAAIPEPIERQLLRIGQEAVTNAVRHGSPSRIDISLEVGPRRIRLQVSDDGGGFDATESKAGHFGLIGMSERARDMGATLKIASQGQGTEITVDVPLLEELAQ